MIKPCFLDDELFRALRSGDSATFSSRLASCDRPVDFSNADFRGCDLRRADMTKLIVRGAYLKDADLRGLDLRHLDLEGCSLHNAKIGGTYFPDDLSASEICMSVKYGTRIRVNQRG